MTQGYSGSYSANGVSIFQPTEGQWVGKDLLGIDGQGRKVYPALKEFQLSWGLLTTTQLSQLINLQLAVSSTGSVVIDLPEWGASGYIFKSYSGTYISEPEVGAYFSEHVTDTKLVVSNIRVG